MNRSIRLVTSVPKAKSLNVSRGFATQKGKNYIEFLFLIHKDISSLKPERKLLLDTFDQVVKEYAWLNDPNTNVYKKLEEKYGSEAAAKMKADMEAKAGAHFNSNLATNAH